MTSRSGRTVGWRQSAGLTDYAAAVADMEKRVEAIRNRSADEQIWLVEHPPLYTAGTSARPEDLLEPERFPVFRSARGGQYTYHGPGQRVAYAMLDLGDRGRNVRCFVSFLESWIIETLAAFGVVGERREGRVGIWLPATGSRPESKIAAIGVRVRRWVSFHGIAINVAPDLSHYAGIVPCGARGFGVTSLADLGIEASMDDVDESLRAAYAKVFGDPTIDVNR